LFYQINHAIKYFNQAVIAVLTEYLVGVAGKHHQRTEGCLAAAQTGLRKMCT